VVFRAWSEIESRPALRSGLYMAALSATRFNPILSNFYQRLRAKGKPHKLRPQRNKPNSYSSYKTKERE